MSKSFKLFLGYATFLLAGSAKAQTPVSLPANYDPTKKKSIVKVFEALKPVSDPFQMLLLPASDVRQVAHYLDGLGRNFQTIAKEHSLFSGEALKDVVEAKRFDQFGRETYRYLPFVSDESNGQFKADAFQQHKSYYSAKFPSESNIGPDGLNWAYAKVDYDNSPLSRPKVSFSPGVGRIGNSGYEGIKVSYELNNVSENVKVWDVNFTALSIPTVSGIFASNELTKSVSTDGDGLKSIVYKDKSGLTILEKTQQSTATSLSTEHDGWLCTYYVYDLSGALRTIIPPKAVQYLSENNWVLSSDVFNELCFSYGYDKAGRVSILKRPGVAEEYMIYDNKDRPLYTQNGNQRSLNQWTCTVYDCYDRVVSAGMLNGYSGNPDNLTTYAEALPLNYDQANATGSAQVPSGASYEAMCYYYYDNYDYVGAKSFYNGYTFPPNTYDVPDQLIISTRVIGLPTGKKVKVLNSSGSFLVSTFFYDEKFRLVQTIADNVKGGTDVGTVQYNFSGLPLAFDTRHSISSGGPYFPIITKLDYDVLWRVVKISENIYNNGFRDLASFRYNSEGRLMEKKLAPGQAREELIDYSYGLNGELLSMNGQYGAHQFYTVGEDRLFGMLLKYGNPGSNNDRVWDGAIFEQSWRTPSVPQSKVYHYTYDRVGQVSSYYYGWRNNGFALWNSSGNEFNGSVGYDKNGNITNLTQNGILFGQTQTSVIDDLSYTYKNGANTWTNKLEKVTDNTTIGLSNGLVGDFVNAASVPLIHYNYDQNGNLILDENKNLKNGTGPGIIYNSYLDLVEEVKIEGKGIIKYLYDGEGALLSKSFTPTGGVTLSEFNIGRFSYENEDLVHILTNEGRIRVVQPSGDINSAQYLIANISLPNGKGGVYDYFIKDHTETVRIVYTEEREKQGSLLSMEETNASIKQYEESLFGQIEANGNISPGNEVVLSRVNKPVSWTANTSVKVSKLSASGQKVGPNVILKVMAGDLISAKTDFHYLQDPGQTPGGTLIAPVISGIVSSLNASVVSDGVKGASSLIGSALQADPALTNVLSQNNAYVLNSNAPRAYLTILFFDEAFRHIPIGTSGVRVYQAGDHLNPLAFSDFKAPRNGYAYVYLSNESAEPVYFDNLIVTHERSKVIEENHYYPFGMKIAALSSSKLGSTANGKLLNRFGYQGSYSEFDERAKWNEFELRMYDAQIGRWLQADPYDQYASPYVGMGNSPVMGVDPNGGTYLMSALQYHLSWTVAGAMIGAVGNGFASGFDKNAMMQGAAWGAGIGLGLSFVPWEGVGEAMKEAGKDVGTAAKNVYLSFRSVFQYQQWQPFYKSDLRTYVLSLKRFDTENIMGEVFEDIFEEFMRKASDAAYGSFRRVDKVMKHSKTRNSKPDFFADQWFNAGSWYSPQIVKAEDASAYEVKQNNGRGIYLSSNDYQIFGHINNLSAMHAFDISRGLVPILTLVTTADVKKSKTIGGFAASRKIHFVHVSSEYRVINGVYKFRFVQK